MALPPLGFPTSIDFGAVAPSNRATKGGGGLPRHSGAVTVGIANDPSGVFSVSSMEILELTRDPDVPGSRLVWETILTQNGAGPVSLETAQALVAMVDFACPANPSQAQYSGTAVVQTADAARTTLLQIGLRGSVLTVPQAVTLTLLDAPSLSPGAIAGFKFRLTSTFTQEVGGTLTCDSRPPTPFTSDTDPQFPIIPPRTSLDVSLAVRCAPGTAVGNYPTIFHFRTIDNAIEYASLTVDIKVIEVRSVSVVASLSTDVTLDQDSSTPCQFRVDVAGGSGVFSLFPMQVPPGVSVQNGNRTVTVDRAVFLGVTVDVAADAPVGLSGTPLQFGWRLAGDEFHPEISGQIGFNITIRDPKSLIVVYRRFEMPNADADLRPSVLAFDGTNWRLLSTLAATGSVSGPSIVNFRRRLWMAWRGVDGDQGIWQSASSDGVLWDPQRSIGGIGSFTGPTLAVFQDHLVMVWRGIDDDQRLFWSRTADGQNWDPNPQAELGGASGYEASLVVINGALLAIWRGIEGDQTLWRSFNRDGSHWEPQQRTTPTLSSRAGVGLAVFEGQVFMVGQGEGNDQSLWWAHSPDGIDWSEKATVAGAGSDDVPTLAQVGNKLVMVWRGIKDDWHLYWTWRDATHDWQPQQRVHDVVTNQDALSGGRVFSALAAIG